MARLSSFLVRKQGIRFQLRSTSKKTMTKEQRIIMAIYPMERLSSRMPMQTIRRLYCMVIKIIVLNAVSSISRFQLFRHWHWFYLHFLNISRIPRHTAAKKEMTKMGVKLLPMSTLFMKVYKRYRCLVLSIPSLCLLLLCSWEKIMKYWKAVKIVLREKGQAISIKLRSPRTWKERMKQKMCWDRRKRPSPMLPIKRKTPKPLMLVSIAVPQIPQTWLLDVPMEVRVFAELQQERQPEQYWSAQVLQEQWQQSEETERSEASSKIVRGRSIMRRSIVSKTVCLSFFYLNQSLQKMGNKSSRDESISLEIKSDLSKPIRNFEVASLPMKAYFSKLKPKLSSIDEEFSPYERTEDEEDAREPPEPHLDSGILQEEEEEEEISQEESVIEEIKIKWNSFIKMKKKNYLEEYTIIKEIGKGGFGTVSKVKAKYTGVVRAAKKIKKSALAKGEHEKLFEEMAIMINLDHPNIARLFEVYDYKSSYVLILELCEGGELFKRIVTKRTNQQSAAAVMTQLLKALVYLHEKGIVHRDLKPQNILFEQGSNYLKLIDFGIAIHHNPSAPPLSARIGTPYYIAPEVLCKRYNQKCDIWSAGVILYMMLTFKPPFSGDSELSVMQKIIKSDPSFSHHGFNNVTGDCIDFLKKMLSKNPQKRLSALQAYNHPWIQKHMITETDGSNQEALQNLSTFKFSNKFEAVVYTYIVSQILSSDEKNVLKQLFQRLDINHDGVISCQEFKNALIAKKDLSEDKIKFLVRVIDTNGSGQIDFTEFIVAALEPEKLNKNHFEQAFAYFDIDHSGTITYDEIAAFLEDQENSQDEIRKIFKDVDQNMDGLISKEEFLHILTSKTRERTEEKQKKSRIRKGKSLAASRVGSAEAKGIKQSLQSGMAKHEHLLE